MKDYNCSDLEELLTMLEQMQDEIEELRVEYMKKEEQCCIAQQTISNLSLQESILKNKVQEQSQEIANLNGRIETLNRSDLELKEAKRLKQEAMNTVSAAEADAKLARKEADRVRREADDKVHQIKIDISRREKAVTEKENRLNAIEADVEGEVGKRVQNLIIKERKVLEDDYKVKDTELDSKYTMMTAGYKIRYYMSLFYGIFITCLMAVLSKTIRSEFVIFFKTTFTGLYDMISQIWKLGGIVAKIGDIIPQYILAFIVHWTLQIVVSIGGSGFIVMLSIISIKNLIDIIKVKYADEISAAVILIILALIVNCDDYIVLLPINLVLLYIMMVAGYILIRAFIEWDDNEAKRNILVYFGMTILCVALIWIGFLLIIN